MQRGLDARPVQLGLSNRCYNILAESFFGQTSARIVREFQTKSEVPVTEVVATDLIAKPVS